MELGSKDNPDPGGPEPLFGYSFFGSGIFHSVALDRARGVMLPNRVKH